MISSAPSPALSEMKPLNQVERYKTIDPIQANNNLSFRDINVILYTINKQNLFFVLTKLFIF